VLAGAQLLLERIARTGLFKAIEDATFGDVSRKLEDGRGIAGIVDTEEGYFNPVVDLMRDPVATRPARLADEASYA
jgi:beta-lysine 5,6-aminomutase alpha subunit